MNLNRGADHRFVWSAFCLLIAAIHAFAADPIAIAPAKMRRVAVVDERFQSFNVEMVEVTGGRFWAPYAKSAPTAPEAPPPTQLSTPGINPALFRARPPTDFANPRLRRLAAALGPSYVRVSGTWANSTYFHDSDDPPPANPPAGFGGVLTRAQWRSAIEFSRAADALLVTSFAVSQGVREPDGVWTPDQAQKLVAFSHQAGGRIAAAEFFNEPTFAAVGGAPKGYDAAAYGRDFAVFRAFAQKTAPEMLILGPGSIGEAFPMAPTFSLLKTEDMLKATVHGIDAFSHHFYGGVSERCGSLGGAMSTTPDAALSEAWLSRTDRDQAFYAALRDRYEPGKPMWLTETGETACGGNPWASTFIDSFRYLDQLGRLARRGVQVVAHNTLAASDYGLIDETTLTPRPNYWSALLWRKLMGTTVLNAESSQTAVHLYAHCLRGQSGGVAVLAINTDRDAPHVLATSGRSGRYTLTARNLLNTKVELNGRELGLGDHDRLPELTAEPTPAGSLQLPPASITFLAFPDAGNAICQ
jgi:hypothetical protein